MKTMKSVKFMKSIHIFIKMAALTVLTDLILNISEKLFGYTGHPKANASAQIVTKNGEKSYRQLHHACTKSVQVDVIA